MGGPIDMERKGCESIGCYTHIVTLNCDLIYDLDPGMEGLFNNEWNECEAIGCYTYYVTFSYDFDLEFWRSNLKKSSIIEIRR